MNPTEKMRSQKVYFSNDETLIAEQMQCLETLYDFNHSRPSEVQKRQTLMKQIFASVGEGCYIEPPLRANWGRHTHLGKHVYANFNLTLVDDTDITIGDAVMIGPNVTIATAGHPIEPELRRRVGQFNIPVSIGNNVWIGANSVVLPGVTIGENTVIGAGSVVTKDIPANVVAVGSPCKVLRAIGEHDRTYYFQDRPLAGNVLE
ncbi:sugar O-acetyltransferase [Enterovibrio norvegicus]|uniref:sugar O-acetyltransferase n=1 Tax=Enterovibrio norvegicus TaxID=188144 RepID=UPI000C85B111|nr:sugar O-acetyltransferase [Enterovibrio norvegicus]PML80667.1 galactoside O-acetyltransferase [Enterovibrio norvegicus]